MSSPTEPEVAPPVPQPRGRRARAVAPAARAQLAQPGVERALRRRSRRIPPHAAAQETQPGGQYAGVSERFMFCLNWSGSKKIVLHKLLQR